MFSDINTMLKKNYVPLLEPPGNTGCVVLLGCTDEWVSGGVSLLTPPPSPSDAMQKTKTDFFFRKRERGWGFFFRNKERGGDGRKLFWGQLFCDRFGVGTCFFSLSLCTQVLDFLSEEVASCFLLLCFTSWCRWVKKKVLPNCKLQQHLLIRARRREIRT